MLYIWRLSAYAIVFSIAHASFNLTGNYRYLRSRNRRLRCHVIKRFRQEVSHEKCRELCARAQKCFSLNFYKDTAGVGICELLAKSLDDFRDDFTCFRSQDDSEYNELMEVEYCSNEKECYTKTKRALKDEWYQLGSRAFKLFHPSRTWFHARQICSRLGTSVKLAQVTSPLENQFIAEVILPKLKTNTKLDLSNEHVEDPLAYYRLDGTDKNITLFGSANYTIDELSNTAVLSIPDSEGSAAATPALNLTTTDFTIAFWVRFMVIGTKMAYLYSDGEEPYGFVIWVDKSRRLGMYLKNSNGNLLQNPFSEGGLTSNKWVHIAVTYRHASKRASYYKDGTFRGYSHHSSAVPDMISNDHKLFYLGALSHSAGQSGFNGKMSHLLVYKRALSYQAIYFIVETTSMNQEAWIDLTDLASKGSYKTQFTDPATYFNWIQPWDNKYAEHEDCVVLRVKSGGKMAPSYCRELLPFICMKSIH